MVVAILTWLALYTLIITGNKIGVYKYAMLCEGKNHPSSTICCSVALFLFAVMFFSFLHIFGWTKRNRQRRVDFFVIVIATMGATGFYLLNSVVFFQTAGAAITYLIVIGDTIPVILALIGFPIARQWVIFVTSLTFVSA